MFEKLGPRYNDKKYVTFININLKFVTMQYNFEDFDYRYSTGLSSGKNLLKWINIVYALHIMEEYHSMYCTIYLFFLSSN